MDWIEVTIYTNSNALDVLQASLMDIGINSLVIEDPEELRQFIEENNDSWDILDENISNSIDDIKPNIKVYVSGGEDGRYLLDNIIGKIEELKRENPELFSDLYAEKVSVKDEDWEYNWREYFSAFEIGEKLYIKPVWDEEKPPEGLCVVTIDPGISFGSGQHETTRLCLIELEKYAPGANCLIDIGSGSGILAAAAANLGAKHVIATDIDDNAVAATKETAKINGVEDKITVKKADLIDGITDKADVAVANIFAGTIIRLADDIKRILTDGGIFISTGIITDRVDEVKEAYIKNGFEIINVENIGEWYLITGKSV